MGAWRARCFHDAIAFALLHHREFGPRRRIIDRIKRKQVDAIIEASQQKDPATKPAPKKQEEAPPPEISIDDFLEVDLRVGLIKEANEVEGAKKLLQLTVDLGEDKPRNIFAGIRAAYEASALVGRRVVVVANLAPRKMKFGVSEGMCLAAGSGGKDIWLLEVAASAAPGTKIS